MSETKGKAPPELPAGNEPKDLTDQEFKKAVEAQQAITRTRNEKTTFFGQDAWVFVISGAEIEAYWECTRSPETAKKKLALATLVAVSLCDKNGKRRYEDLDVTRLAGFKPAKELDNIKDIALRINGYGAEGVEEILKNLLRMIGEDGLRDLQENITSLLKSSSKSTVPTS